MENVVLTTRICLRCGHGTDSKRPWILRRPSEPICCPQCHSPYWDRPREIKTVTS